MIDALEQLRKMSSRVRVNPPVFETQHDSLTPAQEAPVDPVLHICPQVVFGNQREPIFRDRTFNSQGMEEARALLVASHRSSQAIGQ